MKPQPKKRKEDDATPAQPPTSALWLAIALALITFLAYGRVATHGFTWWDDQQTLHRNPDFNPPALPGLARYWTEPEAGLYIPVTYTLWGLLAAVAYGTPPDLTGNHLNPALFHFASILVHIGSALLVMALLRRLLRSDDRKSEEQNAWAAFAGAALYALHPVQVESVAWASGLKDLLFGFFSLLTLWQYTAAAQTTPYTPQAPRISRHYVLALLAAVLAMLSKPTAVVIPIAAFVIDFWLIQRPLKKILLSLAPFLAMAAATAIIARLSQPALHVEAAPFWARPFIVADSLAFYLYKLILPISLAVDYGRRPAAVIGTWWIYLTWIAPALVAVAAWTFRRAHPHFLVAALLFPIGALPVLGLLPFEFQGYSTVADHYLYLSMLGPALALAWAMRTFGSPRLTTAAAIVLALLALRTMLQTRHWRDDEALWTHNLHVNPRSFLAHTNLGAHLDRAGDAANATGRMLRQRGDATAAARAYADRDRLHHEAAAHYQRALEIEPRFRDARYALANYYVYYDRYADAAAQFVKLIEVIETLPPAARVRLDDVYFKLGQSLLKLDQRPDAIAAFKRALEVNPTHAPAAKALTDLGA